MKRNSTVNLGNFLLSFSDAIDLASPLLANHQLRVAFISLEIGGAASLSEDMVETLLIAGLLHDVGALSLEEKLSIHNFEEKFIEPHCVLGEALLREVPWVEKAAQIVRYHHTTWQEWTDPIDKPLVMASQIIFLADYLERLVDRDRYILHQTNQIISEISSLSGTAFHPQIVDCFVAVARREEFWLDLVSPRLYSLLLHNGPYKKMEVDLPIITSLTTLFKNIIDFRSRFTATHSSGVAACAEILSRMFGLSESETQFMAVAGNLHDLGKLAIPNGILNKPDSLTKEEFEVIKSHTYFTYTILNSITGFEQIAKWAAYHHEKLDGSGYPFHCHADELDSGSRIMMVADMFTALIEDRPYRKGMAMQQSVEILKSFSNRGLLDSKIINLLIESYGEVHSCVAQNQIEALAFYEQCRKPKSPGNN